MITREIETHLKANMNMTKKQIMISNFLGGISWGFGSAVGATLVVGIIIWILKALGVFTTISTFFPATFK